MAGFVRVRYAPLAAIVVATLAGVAHLTALSIVTPEKVVANKSPLGIGLTEVAVNPATGVGLVVHGVSDRPIHGMFIDSTGAPLLPIAQSFQISSSAGNPKAAFGPRVAFGDGRWLVTYGSVDNPGTAFSRRARFVTHTGNGVAQLSQEFVIASATGRGEIFKGAGLAFVPSNNDFLVTYYSQGHTWVRGMNFDDSDGFTSAGKKVTEGANNTNCPLGLARVAIDPSTSRALIVGQRVGGSGCPQRLTWARLVDGTNADPLFTMKTLATGFVLDQVTAFSNDQNMFVVAWVDANVRKIKSTIVNPDNTLGTQNSILRNGATSKSAGDYKFGQLALAYSNATDTFMLALKGHDGGGATSPMYMMELNSSGVPMANSFKLLTPNRIAGPFPAVSPSSAGFTTVYKSTAKEVKSVRTN